jgi:hypothetical protein
MIKQKPTVVDYSQLVEKLLLTNQFIDKITAGTQEVLFSRKMLQTITDPAFLSQIPE